MGWSIIEGDGTNPPKYIASGIFGLSRDKDLTSYQDHKLELIDKSQDDAYYVLNTFEPEAVVNEIIPAVGGGNFKNATQDQLAMASLSVWQAMAFMFELPVHQIGANTVKRKIAGDGKATKVKVRNGVLRLLPDLEPRRYEWTKIFDESDGLAVSLAWLGYTAPPAKVVNDGRRKDKKKREASAAQGSA